MNWSEVISWIKSIAMAVIIAGTVRYFLFSSIIVHGESMAPTFENDDKVIITKTTKIDRFDQIVFNAPDADEHYIKRVIGVPGDSIEVKDDVLYVNGKATEEPYLDENRDGLMPGEKLMGDFTLKEKTGYDRVPDGYLFVMGDNRRVSKDSRAFGLIPENSVNGEVQLRFYPLSSIQTY